MSSPALTFNERYEQMRGTPTPPGSSHEVTAVEAPVVVDIAAGGAAPSSEGNRTAAPEPTQATEAPAQAGETAADDKSQAAPRGGFQKRISDLERQLEEAKTALRTSPPVQAAPAAAAQPAGAAPQPAAAATDTGGDPEPAEADFKTYAEYLGALSKWNVRAEFRAEAQRTAQTKVNDTLKQRFDAAAAKHADFHQIAQKPIPINDTTQQVILESEHAGELFYYLGSNEAVAREIAGLSPIATIRRLDAILNTFASSTGAAPASETPVPKTQVTGAPRPPSTVKASTTPTELGTHEVKDQKAFTALRAKQGSRDAKRLMQTRG